MRKDRQPRRQVYKRSTPTLGTPRGTSCTRCLSRHSLGPTCSTYRARCERAVALSKVCVENIRGASRGALVTQIRSSARAILTEETKHATVAARCLFYFLTRRLPFLILEAHKSRLGRVAVFARCLRNLVLECIQAAVLARIRFRLRCRN